jgi:hypothetical protein
VFGNSSFCCGLWAVTENPTETEHKHIYILSERYIKRKQISSDKVRYIFKQRMIKIQHFWGCKVKFS